MKLTIVLLIATMLQVSATGFAQKLTLSQKRISIKQIFKEIKKQTGYDVFYLPESINASKTIDVNFVNAPIEEVMKKSLEGQTLHFTIFEKSIVVKQRDKSLLEQIITGFQQIDIKGKVVNENNENLEGATVKIKGTNRVVLTDKQGNFSFKAVDENSLLEISFIGFEALAVPVRNMPYMLQLKAIQAKLEEVVINKGYYSTTQRLNTGSVVQIEAKDIGKQPLNNAIHALQGLVPGMFIQQQSGLAGGQTSVLIRGQNSFFNAPPLYLIDGVPFGGTPIDRQATSFGRLAQPNLSNDPLATLNPNDIESITILKDADATALYGSRGARGVILITTKKGVTGKSRLDVNVKRGTGTVPNKLDLLSTEEYLKIRKLAFANDNRAITNANAADLLLWNQNGYTDFQKLLTGGTSDLTEATASVSGGSKSTTFLLSGTYHDETTVLPGDFNYERASISMKVNHRSDDGRLSLDFTSMYSMNNNNLPGVDVTAASFSIPLNFPLHTSAGMLNWEGGISNPLSQLNALYKTKSNNQNYSGNLGYNFLPNLRFKVMAGMNTTNLDQKQLNPSSSYNPTTNTPGNGYFGSAYTNTYITEPQLDYNANIWKGKLQTTIGTSYQYTKSRQPFMIAATNFASDALIGDYDAAGTRTANPSQGSEYKYASVYGVVNYNLMEKYVLNATFRRDGSSRFGPGKRYGNFGSLGANWILSEEAFLKKLEFVSFAKLRASYGITGSDATSGNYAYMDTYSSVNPYGSFSGFVPSRIVNPNLGWEETTKAEVATELGFLKDRINLSVAMFRNNTDKMLLSQDLPGQTGFGSFSDNLDAIVRNTGIEIQLSAKPVKLKNFSWNLSFNITRSKNELTKFPTGQSESYAANYKEGQPLNIIRGYKFINFVDGIAKVEDRNNDGQISLGLLEDQYVIGTTDPKFYGGLSNSFSYKSFQLDVLFNFVKKDGRGFINFPGRIGSVLTKDLINSPFKASTLATSESYIGFSRYASSDANIVDASYLRLRNVSFSWGLPALWIDKLKLKSARLYLQGQNLFTVTRYDGLDPETMSTGLPPLRMLTAGLQCSF